MALLGAITAGIGLFKGVKKLWYKVKKPVPKVTVPAAAAAGMGIGGGAMTLAGGQPGMIPASTGGLPLGPMAAGATTALSQTSPGGLPVPWWKGPGGKLQLPWNDPRVPEYLKSFALDDAYLKTYYRAPRGYVVLRDAQGRPFAVNKMIAKQFGLWRPKKKPPISVSDWQCYKKAERVEKKLRKIAGPALRKRNSRSSSGSARATVTARATTRRK